MGTPKHGHTRGRTGKRRSHHALKLTKFTKCAKCGAAVLSHQMCPTCGVYSGRQVLTILSKAEKAQAKHDKHKHKE